LPLAESDLEEIWRYTFKTWSMEQADRYHAGIVSAFEEIADGWRVGLPSTVRQGYMKSRVGSHFIYYRIEDASVVVVRILHTKMDVERHLN